MPAYEIPRRRACQRKETLARDLRVRETSRNIQGTLLAKLQEAVADLPLAATSVFAEARVLSTQFLRAETRAHRTRARQGLDSLCSLTVFRGARPMAFYFVA